jgi:ABC-three component (ABC-3C) system Middle Component 2
MAAFDHLVVHTGDIGGPTSLHPALPMRSTELRATDRRGASKCQGKWPDQTFDQAFGLTRGAGSGQHLASVLQEGRTVERSKVLEEDRAGYKRGARGV